MKISTFLMFAFVTGVQAEGIAQRSTLNSKMLGSKMRYQLLANRQSIVSFTVTMSLEVRRE
ncbi:hypothetical protein L950_0205750 [Sphingobacterium sp. IITKGP-BTPF85]|nr:hypothetical protein L950_0205750 [Sphingobacterium sp. IITKGP-BTPF85]